MTRRKFLGTTLAGGATLIAGGSNMILAANSPAVTEAGANSLFRLGGDLPVNRLGFGAMRITGEGIWGWPPDRDNALKVVRRAIDLGVDLIDTADAYGPETSELLIAQALHPYPKDLVIATKGGLTRPGPGQWVPNGRPEYLTRCVENSLKRLQLERTDLWKQGVEGQCAGSGGQGLSRQRCAASPRLASPPISRDVADPWHVFGRA